MLADQLGVDPSKETVEVYLAALGSQSGAQPTGRLPAEQSSFIGREEESDQLSQAVGKPGLVTVVGKGGVGKSRLAQHVARAARYFDGGRFWVPLTTVTQDELVGSSVAFALGSRVGADDPAATLTQQLAPLGPALLVLDGCELVTDGVAELVDALLSGCPTLTVLVTSREALRIPGEQLLVLAPLPEPGGADTRAVLGSPAVQLLAERVRDGGDVLTIDDETAPLLVALCQQCGGLPLALELAAAQLCVMPVGDLLDHLADVVAGDDRLRSVLRRGHALLDADEAAVFRRFAVLDGAVGLPLDQAGGHRRRPGTGAGGPHPARAHSPGAARRSTARVRAGCTGRTTTCGGSPQEQLAEAGETVQAFRYLAGAIRSLLPDDPRAAPAAYEQQVTEVRGSVRSLLTAALGGEAHLDDGLEIAWRLHRYWASTNVLEGHFWLARLLQSAADSPWAPYATYAAGYLSYWAGNSDAAVPELEAAAESLRHIDDSYRARALIFLGGLADDLDRGDDAVGYVRQAIDAAAPYGVDLQVSAAMGMACVLAERADPAAVSFATEAIQLCRSGGSVEQLAAAMPTAAMCCWQAGDLVTARAYVDEARPLHAGGRRIARVVLLSVASALSLADGDAAAAIDHGRDADREATDLGVEREVPLIRSVLARALLAAGDVAGARRASHRRCFGCAAVVVRLPLCRVPRDRSPCRQGG